MDVNKKRIYVKISPEEPNFAYKECPSREIIMLDKFNTRHYRDFIHLSKN